jgi:phosphoribosyl 1,2-cyclic phosphodiesterase
LLDGALRTMGICSVVTTKPKPPLPHPSSFGASPRALRVTVLASGSQGNATLFEARGSRVLVDAGIGPVVLERLLVETSAGGLPDAIVVTHAHHDHVGAAARIARRLDIPVYMTRATSRAAAMPGHVDVVIYDARETFVIGALEITPLPVPHDAAQVAITVDDGQARASIVTDLGEVTGALADHLAMSDVLLVESNYDRGLLESGPYPWFLKRRVDSARGHLSNAQTHGLLRRLSSRTHTVALMHLSETNNRPDVAMDYARDAIGAHAVRLLVAPPRETIVIDATPHRRADRRRAQQLDLFAVA